MNLTKRILLVMIGVYLIPIITIAQSENPDIYSPSMFGFPDSIQGYRTLAVFNLEPLPCTKVGSKVLVVQSPIANLRDYLKRPNGRAIHEYVRKMKLGEQDKWQVEVVGPGISRENLIESYNKLFHSLKDAGCMKAVLPISKPVYYQNDWDEIDATNGIPGFPGAPGYAYFENTNVEFISSIVGADVVMRAPIVGNNQDRFIYQNLEIGGSRLLLNARTNGSTPLKIQAGLLFRKDTDPSATNGEGYLVWTTSALNLIVYTFPTVYTAGHDYNFTISSVACCTDAWDICSMDLTIGVSTYDCRSGDVADSGTALTLDPNYGLENSVFVENQNLPNNPNWYDGFTNPFQVWAASNFDANHLPVVWDTNHRHTYHYCAATTTPSWPATNVLSGSLEDYGFGYFELSGVPPLCDP